MSLKRNVSEFMSMPRRMVVVSGPLRLDITSAGRRPLTGIQVASTFQVVCHGQVWHDNVESLDISQLLGGD